MEPRPSERKSEFRSGREIWNAFQLEGSPPAAVGIASNEPKAAGDLHRAWTFGVLLCLGALVAGLACDTFLAAPPLVYWPASLLALIPAAFLHARVWLFERRRWQSSDYNPKNARFRQVSAGPYMLTDPRP